jgi:hypothetical protein
MTKTYWIIDTAKDRLDNNEALRVEVVRESEKYIWFKNPSARSTPHDPLLKVARFGKIFIACSSKTAIAFFSEARDEYKELTDGWNKNTAKIDQVLNDRQRSDIESFLIRMTHRDTRRHESPSFLKR